METNAVYAVPNAFLGYGGYDSHGQLGGDKLVSSIASATLGSIQSGRVPSPKPEAAQLRFGIKSSNSPASSQAFSFADPTSVYSGSAPASAPPAPMVVPPKNLRTENAQVKGQVSRKRKRGAGACIPCHSRKIRCDAGAEGFPCVNCVHWKSNCRPFPHKINRRKDSGQPMAQDVDRSGEESAQSRSESETKNYCQSSAARMESTASPGQATEVTQKEAGSCDWADYRLPNFVQPLRQDLDAQDMILLQNAEATIVPPAVIMAKVLQSFYYNVYWNLPLIEIGRMRDTLRKGQIGRIRVSLLLLHALTLAASPYLDQETLQSMGFSSVEAASDGLYRKIMVLYNLNCEKDVMAVAQSLMLLANAQVAYCSDKGSAHWVNIAVSLMYRLGLNSYPRDDSIESRFTVAQRRMWKRVWWSGYVLDFLTALKSGHKPFIRMGDWHVPMLQMEDLEFYDSAPFQQPWPKQQLAQAFLEKTILCMRLTQYTCKETTRKSRVWRSMAGTSLGLEPILNEREMDDLFHWIDEQAGENATDWSGGTDNSLIQELP